MIFLFYNLLFHLFFPFGLIYLIAKKKIKFDKIYERFGIYSYNYKKNVIWVHSASVGEVRLAELLINTLKKQLKNKSFILSTNTLTARKLAEEKKIADFITYAPFDVLPAVFLTLKRFKPQVLIIVETELWPNLISLANLMKVKLFLVNGRISEKKFKYYKALRFIYKSVVNNFDLCLMRTSSDELRLKEISPSAKTIRTGDMKYDCSLNIDSTDEILSEFGFDSSSFVIVAGSVHAGEDKPITQLYKELKQEMSNLKLIIAPRYMSRIPIIESLLDKNGIKFKRKSRVNSKDNTECVILDTYGELLKAYSIGNIVFVGGSLVPIGGHNILEPALMGKFTVFGPYIWNFQEAADLLIKNGCAIKVKDITELKDLFRSCFSSPNEFILKGEKARDVVKKLQGATLRNTTIIAQNL